MEKAEILKNLSQFCCSENYYKVSPLSKLNCTDGVQFLRETCQSYWLTDIIASYQNGFNLGNFQTWKLKLNKTGNGAKIECFDDDKRLIVQRIQFTDFPLDEITLWCVDGVILLPSEY